MNRHVNTIAGRLSLRPPQRDSLEILDRVTLIVPPRKGSDLAAARWQARRWSWRQLLQFQQNWRACFHGRLFPAPYG